MGGIPSLCLIGGKKNMSSVNTDSIITTINAFIPIIITMALLGAVMGALGKIKF